MRSAPLYFGTIYQANWKPEGSKSLEALVMLRQTQEPAGDEAIAHDLKELTRLRRAAYAADRAAGITDEFSPEYCYVAQKDANNIYLATHPDFQQILLRALRKLGGDHQTIAEFLEESMQSSGGHLDLLPDIPAATLSEAIREHVSVGDITPQALDVMA